MKKPRTLLAMALSVLVIWGYAYVRPQWKGHRRASRTAESGGPREGALERDVFKPGDARLENEYAEVNARYFGNFLPSIPVVWEPRLQAMGRSKGKDFVMEGLWVRSDDRECILLNPGLKRDAVKRRRALCHEMVHEYLNAIGDTKTHHGPAFQKVLRRLFDEGAFQAIAAGEAEKRRLKAWLDDQQTRLDGMEADIEGRRAGAERMDLADINAFNDLVARYNAGVDRYNAEADRYGLMMAYPDGLNEEALFHPKKTAAGHSRRD